MEMFNQMKPAKEVLESQAPAMECPLGFKADIGALKKEEVVERTTS